MNYRRNKKDKHTLEKIYEICFELNKKGGGPCREQADHKVMSNLIKDAVRKTRKVTNKL